MPQPPSNSPPSNSNYTPRTKVQVILDITYDCVPSRSNKIDIQKILALELFKIADQNKLTWQDVDITYFNYKINLNTKNFKNYKKTQGEK